MVLQVSTIIDVLIVILINLLFEKLLIYMFFNLLLQKEKFDYKLVNFNLIESINTVNHDLK